MGLQKLYAFTGDDRAKLNSLGNFSFVLSGQSTAASQEPGGTNSPIVIEFGPAQSEPDVSLSVGGLITFNTAGMYRITFVNSYGRTGSGGTAILFLRGRLNGVQYGISQAPHLATSESVIPATYTFELAVNAADTFDVQLYRDSMGTNAGGLFKTVSALGWDDSPSSFIAIYKKVL
jgi:hypothetical protein